VPYEVSCNPVSVRAEVPSPWLGYAPEFSASVLLAGPFVNLLDLKSRNAPYAVQRFGVRGGLTVTVVSGEVGERALTFLEVYYLGRGGRELLVHRRGWTPSGAYVEFDRYLDVYTEWRGLGVQGLRLRGASAVGGTVHLDGEVCFDLTWVG